MDYSATFSRHFSRLVWLLMNEVGSVDEQKMSLRALVTVSKSGDVALTVRDWRLFANEQLVPGALTGVSDVAAQMTAHSVESIAIGAGSRPADLLGLARILAASAAPDGGRHITEKLAALAPKTITIATIPESLSEAATLVVPIQDGAPPAPAPLVEPPTVPTAEPEPPTPAAIPASAAAPPPAAPAPPPPAPLPPPANDASDGAAILRQLAAADVSKLAPDELLRLLDQATDVDAATKALDDLVTLAEHSVRVGKGIVVAEIFHGIIEREGDLPDGDIRRAFVLAIRRLSKPALLRSVATLIAKRSEKRQFFYDVLARTGEDGADAVIEQISQAPTQADRTTLLEMLQVLDDGVPALMRMLGDSRWFVVRNAADLLGELGAKAAEKSLVELLRHSDDRVRRSATSALLKLGTPDAIRGVYDAVGDSSPEVRMQVASVLATRKDSKTSTTLIRAIDGEDDGDVQLAMIAALGKVATPDAVQKLVKMAEPEGRLFRKKDTSLRIAAVQALAEARTPAALAALRELAGDKERDVRETVTRALAQAGR